MTIAALAVSLLAAASTPAAVRSDLRSAAPAARRSAPSLRLDAARAQYFYGGYALHEFAAVPAYPASHGCVRVPQSESRAVWRFASIGMRVWARR
jgi:hypothetical protein